MLDTDGVGQKSFCPALSYISKDLVFTDHVLSVLIHLVSVAC